MNKTLTQIQLSFTAHVSPKDKREQTEVEQDSATLVRDRKEAVRTRRYHKTRDAQRRAMDLEE